MSDLPKPISRKEGFLSALSGEEIPLPKPIDREEQFLATMAGATGIELPKPISRKEIFYNAILENGGVTPGPGPGPGPQPTPTPTLPEISDVNFWDYDGTVVAKYTAAEFMGLTELPANPNHTDKNLTALGWNWDLADAQEFVSKTGVLDIGQQYDTADGSSFFVIELDEYELNIGLNVVASSIYHNFTIDWGDNTVTEITAATASNTPVPHSYAKKGTYTIKLIGDYSALGGSSTYNLGLISSPNRDDKNINAFMNGTVRRVFIGSNLKEGNLFYSNEIFNGASKLEQFVISPNAHTYPGRLKVYTNKYANNISSMTRTPCNMEHAIGTSGIVLVVPKDANMTGSVSSDIALAICGNKRMFANTNYGLSATFSPIQTYLYNNSSTDFASMTRIKTATFLKDITTLPTSCFKYCYDLEKITFLGEIGTFRTDDFAQATGGGAAIPVKKDLTIHFKGSTAVPTLNTAFQMPITKTVKFVVPDALYNDWIAATNWSAVAANIVKESEA